MSKRPAPAQKTEKMMKEAKRMAATYQCKGLLDAAKHERRSKPADHLQNAGSAVNRRLEHLGPVPVRRGRVNCVLRFHNLSQQATSKMRDLPSKSLRKRMQLSSQRKNRHPEAKKTCLLCQVIQVPKDTRE